MYKLENIIGKNQNTGEKTENTKELGQGLVEFAIIITFFLAIILGGIQFLMLINEYSAMQQVGRDATVWAEQFGGDTEDVRNLIDRQLENVNIDPAEVTVIFRLYDIDDLVVPEKDSSVDSDVTCEYYRQPVEVELRKDWTLNAMMMDMLTDGFNINSSHKIKHLGLCWRTGGVQ